MYEDCREMLLTGVFFKLAKYHLLGWTTILGLRSELQAVVQRDEKPKECTKKREDPFLSHSHLRSFTGTSFIGFRKPYKNDL
jgi:hypothetical protein